MLGEKQVLEDLQKKLFSYEKKDDLIDETVFLIDYFNCTLQHPILGYPMGYRFDRIAIRLKNILFIEIDDDTAKTLKSISITDVVAMLPSDCEPSKVCTVMSALERIYKLNVEISKLKERLALCHTEKQKLLDIVNFHEGENY